MYYETKDTPTEQKFATTIRRKGVGRAERRAKNAAPVSGFRIVSAKNSPIELLKMFGHSYITLSARKGWAAPDLVEAV